MIFYQNLCEITGDINNDSELNIQDIIILIDTILNYNSTYDICKDINLDQNIDVLDILILINIILNI